MFKLTKYIKYSLLLRWHYGPTQNFTYLTDFSYAALFFDHSFQFLILHLSISVYTQFHSMKIPMCHPHLINTLPLPRFIPLGPTVSRPNFSFPDRFFNVTGHWPSAQLPTWMASLLYL